MTSSPATWGWPPVPEPLLATDLEVHYGRVRALDGVSLRVDPGGLVVLLGANGAGKTTTLRALAGLVPLSAGHIGLGPTRLAGQPPERFAGAGIVLVPEDRGIFGRLTVEQNVLMGLYPRRRRRPDRKGEVASALEPFPELVSRRSQRASSLSGGEQQMLSLARAMAARPSYLLLDEPSRGLAPTVVARLFDLLTDLRRDGTGIGVVEQHVTAALEHADEVHVLERGRVTFTGEAKTLLRDRGRLERAYLGV